MNRVGRLRTAAVAAACVIPLMPAVAAAGHPHRHVDSVKGSAELAFGIQNRTTIDASGSPESAKGYIRFESRSSYGSFRVKVDCVWVHEVSTEAIGAVGPPPPGVRAFDAWVSGRIVKSRGMMTNDGVPWTHALFEVHTYQDPQIPSGREQSGNFRVGSGPIDCTAFEHDFTDGWKNGHFRVRDNDPTN